MIELLGAAAAQYVQRACALLDLARAGAQYPDGDALGLRLSVLGEPVAVDPRSGLPSLRSLMQVDADKALAPEFLRTHAASLPHRAPYFRRLVQAALPPLHRLDIKLMHRDRASSRVQVTRDLVDAATGCLVRFTAVLLQRGQGQVSFQRGDLSRAEPRFAAAMEQAVAGDAEMAFLALAELPGIVAEDVVRGQLGPLCSAIAPGPALLAPALAVAPGGAALHLLLERAGQTVPADKSFDPFASLYRDALQGSARAAVEARREALQYRVVKERRLVCTPELEAPLRAALDAAGAKLVVRSR